MPDEVDLMPVAWSMGWLCERVLELEGVIRGSKRWDDGVPIGFGLDDPDYDPALRVAPPPEGYTSWEHFEEVNGSGE